MNDNEDQVAEAVKKAIKVLTDIIEDENSTVGNKLEACREILKYAYYMKPDA